MLVSLQSNLYVEDIYKIEKTPKNKSGVNSVGFVAKSKARDRVYKKRIKFSDFEKNNLAKLYEYIIIKLKTQYLKKQIHKPK
jgi:hypothetical protein